MRPAIHHLLCAAVLVAGCDGHGDCAKGTVLVTVEFDTASAVADRYSVAITVDGDGDVRSKVITPAGAITSETLEVTFPAGYPTGKQLTVDVVATQQGATVGSGSRTMALIPGCAALTVSVMGVPAADSGVPDQTVAPDDQAIADLIGADLLPGPITFLSPVPYGAGLNPSSVTVGHLDGDGFLDMVILNQGTTGLTILLGRANGTFVSSNIITVGTGLNQSAIADFNKDGRPDIATASWSESNIIVLLGNGDGTFQPRKTTALNAANGVAAGDFDHDGNVDLAVVGYGQGVRIMRGDGKGTFTMASTLGSGLGWAAIVTADVNGDGWLDFAVSDIVKHGVHVSLNKADGTAAFHPLVFHGTQAYPAGIVPLDISGDGAIDLSVACSNGGLSLLVNQGNGTFAAVNDYAGVPSSLAVADFDADGKMDIAVSTDNSIHVFRGQGDGTILTPPLMLTGFSALKSIVAGDFNGDSRPDLAVLSGNTLVVLLNDT